MSVLTKEKTLMIVTGGIGGGGLARVTTKIANYYVDIGWDVVIVQLLADSVEDFYGLRGTVQFENFHENCTKIHGIKQIKPWLKLIRTAYYKHRPSTILCMALKIGALACLSVGKDKNNPRIVVREMNDPKALGRSRFVDGILFKLCRRVNGFIFQTHWEKNCYPQYLSIKGAVVPNPIEVDNYSSIKRENRIVCVGTLRIKHKRQDILLRAFSVFEKSHPDYIVDFFGEGSDKQKLEKLAVDLGINNKIRFHGKTSDIMKKIVNASLFVMTSEYEGMSNSLVEALLLGIPCITSDWNGANEIIENKINGLIFKRGDYLSLAQQMSFYVNNPDIAEKYAVEGKKQKEKYKEINVMPRYEKIISGIE